jgi:hypothetical protein
MHIRENHFIDIQKDGIEADYYFCSIYKKTSEEPLVFFEKGGPPGEMLHLEIPQLPPLPLSSWNFCVVAYRREIGTNNPIRLCQKAVKLNELLSSGSVFRF